MAEMKAVQQPKFKVHDGVKGPDGNWFEIHHIHECPADTFYSGGGTVWYPENFLQLVARDEPKPQWKLGQRLVHKDVSFIIELTHVAPDGCWYYKFWGDGAWSEVRLGGEIMSYEYVPWPRVGDWVRYNYGRLTTGTYSSSFQVNEQFLDWYNTYEKYKDGDLEPASPPVPLRLDEMTPEEAAPLGYKPSPPVEQHREADVSKGDEQCSACICLSPHSDSVLFCRYVAGHTGKHRTGHEPGTVWATGDLGSGFSRKECLSQWQQRQPKPASPPVVLRIGYRNIGVAGSANIEQPKPTLEGPNWDAASCEGNYIDECLVDLRAAYQAQQAQIEMLWKERCSQE